MFSFNKNSISFKRHMLPSWEQEAGLGIAESVGEGSSGWRGKWWKVSLKLDPAELSAGCS